MVTANCDSRNILLLGKRLLAIETAACRHSSTVSFQTNRMELAGGNRDNIRPSVRFAAALEGVIPNGSYPSIASARYCVRRTSGNRRKQGQGFLLRQWERAAAPA